jgi:GNAT superfamily N-acetyltransferase
MTEIRTIKMTECDEFLRLLCRVFSLDYRRARSAFTKEPMFDLDRKWAVFQDGKIVSVLTTVPVLFGDGRGIGIAGVATAQECRGRNLATDLLQEVLQQSEQRGEGRALLFAMKESLYERSGFRVLDDVVSQPLPPGHVNGEPELIDRDSVRKLYEAWSEADPLRLRRDDLRWDHWSWNLKSPYRAGNGYVCHESGRLREALPKFQWAPTAETIEWFGLRKLGEDLGIVFDDAKMEMRLMGRGFDNAPQMFMTDQF